MLALILMFSCTGSSSGQTTKFIDTNQKQYYDDYDNRRNNNSNYYDRRYSNSYSSNAFNDFGTNVKKRQEHYYDPATQAGNDFYDGIPEGTGQAVAKAAIDVGIQAAVKAAVG